MLNKEEFVTALDSLQDNPFDDNSAELIRTAYLDALKEIEIYKRARELYIQGDCESVPCPHVGMDCYDCYIGQARKEIKESNDTPNID